MLKPAGIVWWMTMTLFSAFGVYLIAVEHVNAWAAAASLPIGCFAMGYMFCWRNTGPKLKELLDFWNKSHGDPADRPIVNTDSQAVAMVKAAKYRGAQLFLKECRSQGLATDFIEYCWSDGYPDLKKAIKEERHRDAVMDGSYFLEQQKKWEAEIDAKSSSGESGQLAQPKENK